MLPSCQIRSSCSLASYLLPSSVSYCYLKAFLFPYCSLDCLPDSDSFSGCHTMLPCHLHFSENLNMKRSELNPAHRPSDCSVLSHVHRLSDCSALTVRPEHSVSAVKHLLTVCQILNLHCCSYSCNDTDHPAVVPDHYFHSSGSYFPVPSLSSFRIFIILIPVIGTFLFLTVVTIRSKCVIFVSLLF